MNLRIINTYNSVSPQISGIIKAIDVQGIRKILAAAADEFIRQTRQNLSTNTKYKDKKWPPLSPAYAKRVGRTEATLKRSGALYNSIQKSSPRNGWIEVFTKNPYAGVHFAGSKKRNIPQRNFFPMQLNSLTYSRPTYNSEKDLIMEIGKRFNILSGGVLPRLSSGAISRSSPSYGNPFTQPQGM
jgi:phage gpG-like protein